MYTEFSEPERKAITPFTRLRSDKREEFLHDLVRTQINFGLSYAREAVEARKQGRLDYSNLAHTIASNAYASAIRFSERLSDGGPHSIQDHAGRELRELKAELDKLSRAEPRCIRRLA